MADLLIEIFGEEIPARMQERAIDDFQNLITKGLKSNGIDFDKSESFITPRRMVLHLTGLPLKKPELTEEKRGPRVDAPEKAIEGFLKSNNIKREECEERETPKGTFLFAIKKIPEMEVKDAIKDIIKDTVFNFPWPKSMRFGQSKYSWVRPMHSGICLFDNKPIEFALDFRTGDFVDFATNDAPTAIVRFSNITNGHRIHGKRNIKIESFADYKEKMKDNFVIIDAKERQMVIKEKAKEALNKIDPNLEMVDDIGLIKEVAGLVEYPVILVGKIKDKFMELPPELLRNSMKVHQKYFAVKQNSETNKDENNTDGNEQLAPYFIVATNIMARDGGVKSIDGYERVLSARFADAEFFFEQDKKKKLEDYLPKLGQIKFHEKLGNMEEKSIRLENLARFIAEQIEIDNKEKEDAARAAYLSKCDLVTEMVFEFPELQGIMGGYYAKSSGENSNVAKAIYNHYSPKGINDNVPSDIVSKITAMADKIDTIVGFFAVGIKPTGSGDPFALRRSILGVIRILKDIDNDNLLIPKLFEKALSLYIDSFEHIKESASKDDVIKELMIFTKERLKVYLLDQGYSHNLVDAVLCNMEHSSIYDTLKRLNAIKDFTKTADGEKLTMAFKRSFNILSQGKDKDKDSDRADIKIDPELLREDAEKILFNKINEVEGKFNELCQAKDYIKAMQQLSHISSELESFFDNVTVNDDNKDLRQNRLAILRTVVNLANKVCDFSKLS